MNATEQLLSLIKEERARADKAEAQLADLRVSSVAAEEAAWEEKRQVEAIAYMPCPKGCGCETADDPDRRDCACDGPCCMADEWPISWHSVARNVALELGAELAAAEVMRDRYRTQRDAMWAECSKKTP